MKWIGFVSIVTLGALLHGMDTPVGRVYQNGARMGSIGDKAYGKAGSVYQEGAPGSSLFVPPVEERDYWPTEEWQTKKPEEVGLDPPAIQRMEEYAFKRSSPESERAGIRTDGVVIIKNGYLVYERYAGGYEAGKRHLIWSASKSVTNAMYGIAVRLGLLKLDDAVYPYYPALDRKDSRGITFEHLLHMSSGLYAKEGFESSPLGSTVNSMLFSLGHQDMGAYASDQPSIAEPDTRWEYSSLTSTLLMAILKNTMDSKTYEEFPWTQLFDRLGMHSAVWERDLSGTFVGSSYVYLTPRDMARFGFLFLNDGVWEGQRILAEGWVRDSTTVAPAMRTTKLSKEDLEGGSYGAQWWLNRAVPEWGIRSAFPDAPEDLFYADGHWGQEIFVIPSLDMIIAVTADDRDGATDWNLFLKLILEGVEKGATL